MSVVEGGAALVGVGGARPRRRRPRRPHRAQPARRSSEVRLHGRVPQKSHTHPRVIEFTARKPNGRGLSTPSAANDTRVAVMQAAATRSEILAAGPQRRSAECAAHGARQWRDRRRGPPLKTVLPRLRDQERRPSGAWPLLMRRRKKARSGGAHPRAGVVFPGTVVAEPDRSRKLQMAQRNSRIIKEREGDLMEADAQGRRDADGHPDTRRELWGPDPERLPARTGRVRSPCCQMRETASDVEEAAERCGRDQPTPDTWPEAGRRERAGARARRALAGPDA